MLLQILAQLDKVDPGFLKQFMLLVIGALGAAGTVIAIQAARNKKRDVSLDPPLPNPLLVSKATEWATEALCAARHAESREAIAEVRKAQEADRLREEQVQRSRSAGIYSKLEEFRKELSQQNAETRKEMQRGFQDIERSIGRLEGKVKED